MFSIYLCMIGLGIENIQGYKYIQMRQDNLCNLSFASMEMIHIH